MIIRTIFLVSLFFFATCSNAKKDATIQNDQQKSTEVETLEVSAPEGVIIQEQSKPDTLKGSPEAYAMANVGNAKITIEYHSPAVRGRTIWGGLVAYDHVWVTGAHKATSIKFDKEIKIGETILTAGKYAIFTIPGKDQWIVIINKNWNQHLADEYSQTEDVVRLKVVPEIEEKQQERLRYVIEKESDTAGEIVLYWEKLEVSVPFEIIE
jgi:hypothetical protein